MSDVQRRYLDENPGRALTVIAISGRLADFSEWSGAAVTALDVVEFEVAVLVVVEENLPI